MKVKVFNQQAKEVKDIELNDFTENNKVNDKVLSQYVYIYLSNQREGNASTKDRSEVRGGGKKPWAQKGTGRARVGSSRSPIWRAGGVTFGPNNNVNWKRHTTRNFRRSAFQNTFTKLLNEGLLKVIDSIELKDGALTKQALDIVKNFDVQKKVTLVTSEKNSNLIKAFSNLENSKVVMVSKVNPYVLMTGGTILLEEKALEYINEKWGRNK